MRYNQTEIMRAQLSFFCAVFLFAAASLRADSRLADAAMAPNPEAVRSLLKQKIDVNTPQPDGTTALHWAVRQDDLETADLLIRAGANVKAANRFGATPLSLAATNGNAAMIEKLLKAGEDANAVVSESGDSVLMLAARTGKPAAVAMLLNHGADVNKTNATGQTALMWAAAEKNAAAVQILIEHKADFSIRTHAAPPPKPMDTIFSAPFPVGGMTALLFAARQNDMKSAAILLAAGADVKESAQDGTSPILVAILNGHYTLANFLLEH